MSLFVALGYELPFAVAVVLLLVVLVPYVVTASRPFSRTTWKRTIQYSAAIVVAVGLGLLALIAQVNQNGTPSMVITTTVAGYVGSIAAAIFAFFVYMGVNEDPSV